MQLNFIVTSYLINCNFQKPIKKYTLIFQSLMQHTQLVFTNNATSNAIQVVIFLNYITKSPNTKNIKPNSCILIATTRN